MMGGQICACDIVNEEYAHWKQHLPKSPLSLYIHSALLIFMMMMLRKQAEDPEREVDVETLLPGDLDENLNR